MHIQDIHLSEDSGKDYVFLWIPANNASYKQEQTIHQKRKLMKSTITRNLIIVVAVSLIVYALADGINRYNALSIFLALGGFAALCVGIYLHSQLQLTIEEEEEEQ